jgi:hypothetical protein
MDGTVAVVVSLLCLFAVIIVSIVIIYQTSRVKEQTARNIQDLVDQVNESASYAYKFDISQDDNIKTMEKNINLINENINNIGKNVKIMQDSMNAPPPKPAYTENVKTGILSLGDRFNLMKVSDNDSDTDWLGVMNADKTKLHGGLAVYQAYVHNKFGVEGALYVGGAKSTHNPDNLPTIFAYDDKNYVRGDTDVHGVLEVAGAVTTDDKFCIKDTCIAEQDLKAMIGRK